MGRSRPPHHHPLDSIAALVRSPPPGGPTAPLRKLCLLARERKCQAGNDEGYEKNRQDGLSAASEADDFTLGDVEGPGPAGVSAVADLQGVRSRFDRYVDRLVQFDGPDTFAVD